MSNIIDFGGMTQVVNKLKVGAAKPGREKDATLVGLSSRGVGYDTGTGGTVTQTTSITTAVTLNKLCGSITTVSATTAAGAEDTFTVNNNQVTANDVVVVTQRYSGAGTPQVYVSNVANGSFNITISNLHASSALNAALTINFMVLANTTA